MDEGLSVDPSRTESRDWCSVMARLRCRIASALSRAIVASRSSTMPTLMVL